MPQSPVKTVLISVDAKDISQKLENCAVKTINITAQKSLYPAVRSHADMQVCHLGGNKIVCADLSSDYVNDLRDLEFEIIPSQMGLKSEYPSDIPLNSAFLGKNHLICGVNYTDQTILNHAKQNVTNIIDTKQGYAKCSTCIVTENAIITSDKSIEKSAVSNGIDALLIRPGYITLTGLDYGFIGGASGLIDKDLMAFCGDIKLHPDFDLISDFLWKYRVDYLCLSDSILQDIGGILPIICH